MNKRINDDKSYNKCNMCNSNQQRLLYSIKQGNIKFEVVKCKCGLVFVNPRYNPDWYNKYYEEDYFKGLLDNAYHSSSQFNQEYEKTYRRYVDFFLNNQFIKKKGNYLDIGCASGHLVGIFNSLGWNASGIDVSEYSTKYGREIRGLNIITGDLLEAKFPSNHFEIITMLEVIEHLSEPMKYLEEIKRILSNDGTLIVSTPNVDYFLAKLRREKWWGYKIIGHIHFFSIKTMSEMLDKLGLEIYRIDSEYCYGRNINEISKRKEKITLILIKIFEYTLVKKVTPKIFKYSISLANTLTPTTFYFIKKKNQSV